MSDYFHELCLANGDAIAERDYGVVVIPDKTRLGERDPGSSVVKDTGFQINLRMKPRSDVWNDKETKIMLKLEPNHKIKTETPSDP